MTSWTKRSFRCSASRTPPRRSRGRSGRASPGRRGHARDNGSTASDRGSPRSSRSPAAGPGCSSRSTRATPAPAHSSISGCAMWTPWPPSSGSRWRTPPGPGRPNCATPTATGAGSARRTPGFRAGPVPQQATSAPSRHWGVFRKSRRPPEGRAPRRQVRAIARRRSALTAELFGRFGNAASARARRRGAGGTFETRPRFRAGIGSASPGRRPWGRGGPGPGSSPWRSRRRVRGSWDGPPVRPARPGGGPSRRAGRRADRR